MIHAPHTIALVLALSACAVPPPSEPLLITSDLGGDIVQRIDEILQLERANRAVMIEGACMSACTMYLALEDVCLMPSAVLGFHVPYYSDAPMTNAQQARWVSIIAAHYPATVEAWFRATAGPDGKVHLLGGSELIAAGVAPACGEH